MTKTPKPAHEDNIGIIGGIGSSPAGPFTAESLFELLNKVLLTTDRAARRGDRGIADFASHLNLMAQRANIEASVWTQEAENIERALPAIETLINVLPLMAPDYVEAASNRNFHGLPFSTEMTAKVQRSRQELETLERLYQAALAARRLGLPRAFYPAVHHYTKWKYFASDLAELFHEYLPGHSKEAGYRFIKEVVPSITDETTTIEAVKSQLKKKRPVNRGKGSP
jgi:hypothetical protein